MYEPSATPPANDVPTRDDEGGEALQFDQAEFDAPPPEHPACSVCHRPILDEYYEINQRLMCPMCRQGVEAAFRGGSRFGRLVKATVLGSLAAILGAIIYYAFVRITSINLGLIAILLGAMVGMGVRKGTGNRGGLLYQFLAVFLTYISIAGMLVPDAIEALVAEFKKADQPAVQAPVAGQPQAGAPQPAGNAPKAEPAHDPQAPAAAGNPANADINMTSIFLFVAIMIGFFLALPAIAGASSPISGLIFLFALWEAWKMNKRVHLVFNGPYRLAPAGGEAFEGEEVPDAI